MTSLLHTDAYKLAMAEAGWPLRRETFTFTCRQGGPHLLPFDVRDLVARLLPDPPEPADAAWLTEAGYPLPSSWREALRGSVEVAAIPRGSWFFDKEPAWSLTGPSAVVSWLEPLLIQLHYRIQVATLARLDPDALPAAVARVSCEAQRDAIRETLDAIGVSPPTIDVDSAGYVASVRDRVRELVRIVEDPSRVFEVGLRAVTCSEQHLLALEAVRDEGVTATSHLAGARTLGLRPVGTMGHEHAQRYGSDEAAFRAMLERRAGPADLLLDTYATLDSGLPAAFALIREFPDRGCAIRYDSGDKEAQYLYACAKARDLGVRVRHVLEDAFDADLTRRFEALRAFTGVPAEDQRYGIGGHIVRSPHDPLPRDRVSAAYKLSQTGPRPTMKFGDASGRGKESLPGRPVLVRVFGDGKWTGMAAQHGEEVDADAVPLTDAESLPRRVRFTTAEVREFARPQPLLSPATRELVRALHADRDSRLREIRR